MAVLMTMKPVTQHKDDSKREEKHYVAVLKIVNPVTPNETHPRTS